jgi:hypothetical protein
MWLIDHIVELIVDPQTTKGTKLQAIKYLAELCGHLTMKEKAFLRIGTKGMEEDAGLPNRMFAVDTVPSLEAIPPPPDSRPPEEDDAQQEEKAS